MAQLEEILRPPEGELLPYPPKFVFLASGGKMVVRQASREDIPALLRAVRPLTEVERDFYDIVAARTYVRRAVGLPTPGMHAVLRAGRRISRSTASKVRPLCLPSPVFTRCPWPTPIAISPSVLSNLPTAQGLWADWMWTNPRSG